MATDNTQDRINEINHPDQSGLDIHYTGDRDTVVSSTDHARHGLDDNSEHDPEKGAALGGLGGAAVGAAAGSIAGPIGTLIGAVAGGLVGAGASGTAVAAIDSMDNDNTISGIGDGATRDSDMRRVDSSAVNSDAMAADDHGHNIVTGGQAHTGAGDTGLAGGAVVGGVVGAAVGGPIGAVVGGTLGSLAGGVAGDAAEAADEEDLTTTGTRGAGYTEDYTSETEILSNPGINNPGIYNAGVTTLGMPLTGTPMTGLNPTIVGDTTMGDTTTGDTTTGEGHNIVTGGPATTEAGDDGLIGGAVVGGVVGAAVGGPVGAVVGGTIGSLAGGVAGDAAEASADDETNIRVNSKDV